MSTSTIIVLLSLSEFALLTTAIATFLFIRSRKHKNLYDIKPHTPVKMVDAPHADFPDFLEKYMLNTEKRMQTCGPEEVHLLSKRLEFLQSELQAFQDTDDDDAYWSGIYDRMSKLVAPQQLEQTAAEDDTLDELDDIDGPLNKQSDIPVLDEQISPKAPPPKGSVTVDTSKDELKRLRNIISRQHNSIDELKKTVLKNNNLDTSENGKLAEQLEEIEVAHAQLNMCIEVLEQENNRLNEVIGSMAFGDESVNIDATLQQQMEPQSDLEFDQIDIDTKDDSGNSDDDRPVLDDVDLDGIMQQYDGSTPDNSPGDPNSDHNQSPDLESAINEILDISEDTQQKTG